MKKAFSVEVQAKNSLLILSTFTLGVAILLSLIAFGFTKCLSQILEDLAYKIGRGAEQVARASHEVSSAGAKLSSSATEQAAALQETVSSLEEVSAMIGRNAENANQSQSVSTTSQGVVNEGNEVVAKMIQSVEDISQSNSEIMKEIEANNQEFSQIVKVISAIGEKTRVINDIVFQTKILSFNASVEAARAGEHGKGFAVVAEEVGNLARMSGSAATEISQMLENSIIKVENTVNNTKIRVVGLVQTGRQKVEIGTTTAKKCGEVLDEVVQNVTAVGKMISEIACASQEQAQGVTEINKAMTQLDQVTQQNATASQQAALAAEDLKQQAASLRSVVQSLITTVTGKDSLSA